MSISVMDACKLMYPRGSCLLYSMYVCVCVYMSIYVLLAFNVNVRGTYDVIMISIV